METQEGQKSGRWSLQSLVSGLCRHEPPLGIVCPLALPKQQHLGCFAGPGLDVHPGDLSREDQVRHTSSPSTCSHFSHPVISFGRSLQRAIMCGHIPSLDGWEPKSCCSDAILRLGGESLHVKTQMLVLGSTHSTALPMVLCRAEDVAHPGSAHIQALLKYWGIFKGPKACECHEKATWGDPAR